MAEPVPRPARFLNHELSSTSGRVRVTDESDFPKWRTFHGPERIGPGTSRSTDGALVWSVSPGEWTIVGSRPEGDGVVDLTHVRAMFRLSGGDATRVLSKLCALDLGDGMFPDGAAARTLVAGVAAELVRDDRDGAPSYLLLPSRSFGRYLADVLIDAGAEFGLKAGD